PDEVDFTSFPDRQSPWILAQAMPEKARVSLIRQAGWGAFLDRPLVKPVVARCGGLLVQRDLLAVAYAGRARSFGELSNGAKDALETVYSGTWDTYPVTFTTWGDVSWWREAQISRKGGNLVLQLGFPAGHGRVFAETVGTGSRKEFEVFGHPVRRDGRPTLAWVRLDIDLESGTALIEEIQSDWLRCVSWRIRSLERRGGQSRQLRALRRYQREIVAVHSKNWAETALLAALMLLVEEFAVRQIWMHRPEVGAALKGIIGALPPRSLYSNLPKSFGFRPTGDIPPFLSDPIRKRALQRFIRGGKPLFWRLDLRAMSGGTPASPC
ncbi:MAG: hypothetical protein AAF566_12545, partial [Pseudomonadota bacterium]